MPARPPSPSVADDLAFARSLADLADAVSMTRFGALDLRVDTKPDMTPVSDADRSVEQELRTAIAAGRPADDVLGEEFGGSATQPLGRRWVLDPIDATKNFVRGVPVWATLIALMDGAQVRVGVVSAPALGTRWWAGRGLGSWLARAGRDPQPNHVSGVTALADASLSYSERSEWGGRIEAFDALDRSCWRSRAYGDFWSYMLVAQGAVDIACEPQLSLWDVAALVPVVEEAGGRATAIDGITAPGSAGLLCTNGLLHDPVVRALRA